MKSNSRPKTDLPIGAVRRAKPKDLPDVEPGLRTDLPRDVSIFTKKDGKPLSERDAERLAIWHAVKAWVVRMVEEPDREGPDYHIWLGYSLDGEIRQTKMIFGFDLYHWAVGSPDHCGWFSKQIKEGGTVTLLVSPDGEDLALFGNMQAYVKDGDGLVWAADR